MLRLDSLALIFGPKSPTAFTKYGPKTYSLYLILGPKNTCITSSWAQFYGTNCTTSYALRSIRCGTILYKNNQLLAPILCHRMYHKIWILCHRMYHKICSAIQFNATKSTTECTTLCSAIQYICWITNDYYSSWCISWPLIIVPQYAMRYVHKELNSAIRSTFCDTICSTICSTFCDTIYSAISISLHLMAQIMLVKQEL